jgi:hypothetical protein
MLIEFRVKNFRSFRGEAVLNLSASSDKTNELSNVAHTGNKAVPRLLRSAGIYGANAGGKSNLVRAMQLLRGIVNESAGIQAGQALNVQPFRLASASVQEPIEFEITFLLDGTRYQFGFTLTPERIESEWLIAYKTSQPATWYERKLDRSKGKYDYKFSAQLHGAKSLWSEATRDNSLFLSMAVQLNSEQLRPIFDFITKKLVVFENGSNPIADFTVARIAQTNANKVRAFLAAADIGIADIHLKKQQAFVGGMHIDLATGKFEPVAPEPREITVPTFEHRSPAGSAVFDIQDDPKAPKSFSRSLAHSSTLWNRAISWSSMNWIAAFMRSWSGN